ncbi:MAG: hypothetical protein AAFY70_16315 [Bacteroidota bacterium]
MPALIKRGIAFLFVCLFGAFIFASTPEEGQPLSQLKVMHVEHGGAIESFDTGELVTVKVRGKRKKVTGMMTLLSEDEVQVGEEVLSIREIKTIQHWESRDLRTVKGASKIGGVITTSLGLVSIGFAFIPPVTPFALVGGLTSIASGQLMLLPSLLINPKYKLNRKLRLETS